MFGKEWMTGFHKLAAWFTAVLGFTLLVSSLAGAQSVPPAVISGLSSVNAPGLAGYQSFIAVDACGDIYTIQNPNNNLNGGQVTEIPAGGGTPQVVITAAGQPYYYVNLWIDPAKANLYVSEGADSLIQIPIKNCVLQTSSQNLIDISNLGAVSYYYYTGGVATDAAGNIFVGNIIFCCGASYELVEETPGSTTGTALLTGLVNPITSIAIDTANNIFYTDTSGQVSELPYKGGGAYASTPVLFGGSYTNAIGVVFDNAGNLYVTDAGAFTIYEIPYETSALNPADRFVVANITNLHNQAYGGGSDLEIASPSVVDSAGNIYFIESLAPTNGDPQTSSVVKVTRGSAVFDSSAVGTASSATTLNFAFNATVTPAAINFLTTPGVYASAGGGTCAAGSQYKAGDTCTINVKFTPAVPGLGSGAVVLADANGAAIASASLSGIGLGAGLTIDPGEGVAIGSGFKTPTGVAVDLAGDVFIADSTNSQVLEVVPGNAAPVAIGSGLNAPTGVAVDAAGNVYIADTGNNQIVEVPFLNGALSSSAQSVIVSNSASIAGSTLNGPAGLSIDSGGNLYIADSGNNRVVYLPEYGNFDTAGAVTLGSGFSKPLATTVTPSGTIYIADTGNGNLYSLPNADPAAPKTLIANGYTEVTALATDAAGDLFVVDAGKTLISRIPNIGGALVTGSALNITGTIVNPFGVALDPAGNLYATDNIAAAAYSVSRTSATQDFGNWNPDTTSNTLSFLLENSGNQPLTFASPFDTVTGDTAVFNPVTPSNPCANSGTVAVGANCLIEATFTPTDFAHYSETFTFESNAENTAASQATFTGTGFSTLATTTTLAITSPTGNPYYGQPIQLAVTVAASSDTPSGSVALLVDGLKTTTATLANGATMFTLPSGLSGGTHTLQASYLGANTGLIAYSQSQSAVLTTTVTSVATTTTVSAQTLYINPISQPAGNAVSLIATVSSTFKGIPSGTVTFLIDDPAGSPLTVSAPLLPVSSGVFEAIYKYTPLAPAPGATFDVVTVGASYSGDGNFAPSSLTAPAAFYVSPTTGSIGITSSSYSITANASGTSIASSGITFTASSYGGWTGYVGFHCLASSLPANAICSFTPGRLQVQSSNAAAPYPPFTTQLSILINNPPNSPAQSGILWWISGFFGIVFFFTRRRLVRSGVWNTTVALLVCLICLGATGGLSGCGSGNNYITPKGTSTVTVVADSDYGTNNCPVNQATGQPDLTRFPCSEQTFSVKLTIQ